MCLQILDRIAGRSSAKGGDLPRLELASGAHWTGNNFAIRLLFGDFDLCLQILDRIAGQRSAAPGVGASCAGGAAGQLAGRNDADGAVCGGAGRTGACAGPAAGRHSCCRHELLFSNVPIADPRIDHGPVQVTVQRLYVGSFMTVLDMASPSVLSHFCMPFPINRITHFAQCRGLAEDVYQQLHDGTGHCSWLCTLTRSSRNRDSRSMQVEVQRLYVGSFTAVLDVASLRAPHQFCCRQYCRGLYPAPNHTPLACRSMCSGCTLGASWTALDMAGLSLSVLRLDDGRLQRLHAPTKVFIISSLLQLITIRQT